MPHYPNDDELFTTPSPTSFLSPSKSVPRRPSRQGMKSRKSVSPHPPPSSLAHAFSPGGDDDEDGPTTLNGAVSGGNRQHSLAHELAFALMPEPSAGSKLLAEEFGIEYDEGAEGIDEPVHTVGRASKPQGIPDKVDTRQERNARLDDETRQGLSQNGLEVNGDVSREAVQNHSFAEELGGIKDESLHNEEFEDAEHEGVSGLGSPLINGRRRKPVIKTQRPEVDAMDMLAQDLQSTETFLKHLRTLDSESGAAAVTGRMSMASSHQPALERYASDIIRRMDEAARNREGQLRELLEYDREFKKIAGEVNGTEVLSRVDELPSLDDGDGDGDHDYSSSATLVTPTAASPGRALDTVAEEDDSQQNEWDIDPHVHLHNDTGEDAPLSASLSPSPTKATFLLPPPPPPLPPSSKATPGSAIPYLAHFRTFTSSLISSLTTLSEQAQVNGAATTEAGRKIKALKNMMGGWQMEWESAEKSRVRIEKWEAGVVDWQNGDSGTGDAETLGSVSPARLAARRRVDGRKLVEEYLVASEKAIRDATERTQAIMAR